MIFIIVKTNDILIIGGGVLALMLLSKNSFATGVNFDSLKSKFNHDDVYRLQVVAEALARAGVDTGRIKMMLAQILHETGIFTDNNKNHRATDQLNNYAGISKNGQLKGYNTVDDFVVDYLRVLNLPSHHPIEATNITDFNDRLKANGYYTDSKSNYGNALNYYYNLL